MASNGHPQDDPPDNLKRKAYLTSLTVSFPAVLLLWFTLGYEQPFVRLVFPVLALFCAVCAWTLWRNVVSLKFVERVTFIMVTVLVFSHLIYKVYSADNLAEVMTELTETTYTSMAILCLISFLIFENNLALKLSLTTYAASLLIVLGSPLLGSTGWLSSEEISWIFRMYAFLGSVIAFVYVLAYSKEQLVRQRTTAETMQNLAYTDHLTGLANRRQLYVDLEREIKASERYERPLSIILFDLDHFKQINDTYGHQSGDLVLQRVARTVESRLRSVDHFGRWGGEEFIIVSPETNLEQATFLAERVREALNTQSSQSSVPTPTASFGVTQYLIGEDIETFLQGADEALYLSKTQGRNRIEFRH